jgi:hypothetical protein
LTTQKLVEPADRPPVLLFIRRRLRQTFLAPRGALDAKVPVTYLLIRETARSAALDDATTTEHGEHRWRVPLVGEPAAPCPQLFLRPCTCRGMTKHRTSLALLLIAVTGCASGVSRKPSPNSATLPFDRPAWSIGVVQQRWALEKLKVSYRR